MVNISLCSQLLAAGGFPNPPSIHARESRISPFTSNGTAIYWEWGALSTSQQGLPPSSQQDLCLHRLVQEAENAQLTSLATFEGRTVWL